MHLPITTVESGIHPVYFCSAHRIEMLLKAELPLVFSAFHMSGFTPSQVTDESVSKYQQLLDLNPQNQRHSETAVFFLYSTCVVVMELGVLNVYWLRVSENGKRLSVVEWWQCTAADDLPLHVYAENLIKKYILKLLFFIKDKYNI